MIVLPVGADLISLPAIRFVLSAIFGLNVLAHQRLLYRMIRPRVAVGPNDYTLHAPYLADDDNSHRIEEDSLCSIPNIHVAKDTRAIFS